MLLMFYSIRLVIPPPYPVTSVAGKTGAITSIEEGYIGWGGKNLSGYFNPIDAALIPQLGANRFAGSKASAITVEYSQDGGSTWTDYGASDDSKTSLFTTNASFAIGKNTTAGVDYTNYQLRITYNSITAGLYSEIKKFLIYLSTNGSSGSYVTIQCRTIGNIQNSVDTWTTLVEKQSVSGWSGWNSIKVSYTQGAWSQNTSQYGEVRFIFGNTGYSSSYAGLQVYKIYGYGGVGWATPSSLAANGVPYTYDSSSNVTFPKSLSATTLKYNGQDTDSRYATKADILKSAEIKIGSDTPLNNEVLWINPDGVSSGSSGGGSITVDTSLSSTSTNPVQNKIITSALNSKVSKTDYASQTNAGVAKIWVDSDNYLCINLQ